MARLAEERGFRVVTVLVPTAIRLYWSEFENLPPISEEAHLINYLIDLSARQGFESIDLNEELAPYSSEEMLYYNDDTHWNPRGHQVIAEVLAEYLNNSERSSAGVDP